MAGIREYSTREALNAALGQGGSTFISGTNPVAGNYVAITFIEDTTFTTLTDTTRDGDLLEGATFPAGLTIFGSFTEIELASGTVIAYTAKLDAIITEE